MYGKPYLAAAKDTWRLFVDRGIDALVNDQIVSMGTNGSISPSGVWLNANVDLLHTGMTWGSFFIGGLCALFSFVYLKVTDPSYNSGGGYTPVVLLFSFLIGFQIGEHPHSPIRL